VRRYTVAGQEDRWVCPDVTLVTPASASPKDKKTIWSWAVAQILMLVW
jgi:hypothetical protein